MAGVCGAWGYVPAGSLELVAFSEWFSNCRSGDTSSSLSPDLNRLSAAAVGQGELRKTHRQICGAGLPAATVVRRELHPVLAGLVLLVFLQLRLISTFNRLD